MEDIAFSPDLLTTATVTVNAAIAFYSLLMFHKCLISPENLLCCVWLAVFLSQLVFFCICSEFLCATCCQICKCFFSSSNCNKCAVKVVLCLCILTVSWGVLSSLSHHATWEECLQLLCVSWFIKQIFNILLSLYIMDDNATCCRLHTVMWQPLIQTRAVLEVLQVWPSSTLLLHDHYHCYK